MEIDFGFPTTILLAFAFISILALTVSVNRNTTQYIGLILSCVHTVAVMAALPLYFMVDNHNQIVASVLIAIVYSAINLQFPPTQLHKNKAAESYSPYIVIKETKKLNKKFPLICWYSIQGALNIAILIESLISYDIYTCLGNLLYANSLISMLISRLMLLICYFPSISKFMMENTNNAGNMIDNDLNTLIKKVEGFKPSSAKQLRFMFFRVVFNIWNLMCLAILLMLAIYYLTEVRNTYIQSILQVISVKLLLSLYISLCMINGSAIILYIIRAKTNNYSSKEIAQRMHILLYGLKIICISYAWIICSAFNGMADISNLGGIINPHSWIEGLLCILNVLTIVSMLMSMLSYNIKRREKWNAHNWSV